MIKRLCVIGGMVLATAGCGDDEPSNPDRVVIPIDVTLNPVTFSWSGGEVHALEVAYCGDFCSEGVGCKDGVGTGSGATNLWFLGSIELGPPSVASPVEYGVNQGAPDPDANPLVPGADHYVDIRRIRECDPPEAGCTLTEAAGCAVFTPE